MALLLHCWLDQRDNLNVKVGDVMKKSMVWLLIIMMLVGCATAKKPQPKQEVANKDITVDTGLAQQVKRMALTVPGVQNATAVVINKEMSVAVKVSGFDRLRLKSIREETHHKITKQHQEYTVHVTTDKKLFRELENLEQQINSDKTLSPPLLQDKVKKINQDMHG